MSRLRLLGPAGTILQAYAQIFFSRNRLAGLLLLLATATRPEVAGGGLGALLASLLAGHLLQLDGERLTSGHFGYNALLLGLMLGAAMPAGTPLATQAFAVAFGGASATVFQAALEASLGSVLRLPALTLPFVLLSWSAGSLMLKLPGHEAAPQLASAFTFAPDAQSLAALYLRALASMLFVPSVWAGTLVLLALLIWSRIAALLSLLGFATSALLLLAVAPQTLSDQPLSAMIGCNAIATAIALGGVWLVPQGSAVLFALAAVPFTVGLSLSLHGLLGRLGLSTLILPFNAVMLVTLLALRQRTRDAAPKAVDFPPGTPEANLRYYRTRVARFGALSALRFRLPVAGRWLVTQGFDGPHTHRGEWRHALDFEAADAAGCTCESTGATLEEFHAYRLPVLAAAAGTVVQVVNHVADNPPGQRNPSDPWGNLVLLQHGPALFSLVAHLAKGSVAVSVGQAVAAGERLGACGNSGRSFVPHVHFQVQTSPQLGAPTCAFELCDVVTEAAGTEELRRATVPREGELVRPLDPRPEIARIFELSVGAQWTFEVSGLPGSPARHETVLCGIDLLNRSYLEGSGGDRLFFEKLEQQFIAYDHVPGPRGQRGILSALFCALPRVPFETRERFCWEDALPTRPLRTWATGWLHDFVDPLRPSWGERLLLSSRREGAALVIEGRGQRLFTRAVLMPGLGFKSLEVRQGRSVVAARLIAAERRAKPAQGHELPAQASEAAA